MEVDLGDSGLEYQPGDALGVWPLNCPKVTVLSHHLFLVHAGGGGAVEGGSDLPRPALPSSHCIPRRVSSCACFCARLHLRACTCLPLVRLEQEGGILHSR